jgi:hypothetical protein
VQLRGWSEVGGQIWVPAWEAYVERYAQVLAGTTPRTFPELSHNLDAWARHLHEFDGDDLAPEERYQQATAMLGIGLVVALCRYGWQVRVFPGDDVVCGYKGTALKPFDIVPKLASGELTPEAWHEFCVETGIADLDISATTVKLQTASTN